MEDHNSGPGVGIPITFKQSAGSMWFLSLESGLVYDEMVEHDRMGRHSAEDAKHEDTDLHPFPPDSFQLGGKRIERPTQQGGGWVVSGRGEPPIRRPSGQALTKMSDAAAGASDDLEGRMLGMDADPEGAGMPNHASADPQPPISFGGDSFDGGRTRRSGCRSRLLLSGA